MNILFSLLHSMDFINLNICFVENFEIRTIIFLPFSK